AWVTWRRGGGYYGWAPMKPGISISVSFGTGYRVPNRYWTFVPYNNLYTHSIHRYYQPGRTSTIINNTTVIKKTYVNNHRTYVSGPSRNNYQKHTGRDVRTYKVRSSNTAGHSRVNYK